ncbi:MAG: hypothetical protein U9O90_11425 [Euryarchaeota archaeon]|nr:hypothetical protein [Euryarchaeota archaeon]
MKIWRVASNLKSYASFIYTMIEARAILSKLRKWQNAIDRRLEL